MAAEARARRDAFFAAIGKTPLIMGILNLTPDSFSDGGRFQSPELALAHARRMVEDGCAIVDVGAESTRPEATPVTERQEIARLAPALERIINGLGVAVSIDTTKAIVAALACRLGAVIVNDVWGLQKDPAMADTAAEAEAGVVITHNRAEKDESVDIIADMRRFFDRSLEIAAKAGVPRTRVILDPGIGFAKTSRQNLQAVAGIAKFDDYGLPMLVGASRKRFLGSLTGNGVEGSLVGSIAVNLAAAAAGAAIFRVHDVAENAAALNLYARLRAAA
jgi:dihydropteroate synthase